MFYQKERKIQIFLKNENYTAARKRRASSDSVESETVQSKPGKKIKIKRARKDPQTSSVGSGEKKAKTPNGSLSPRSVSVSGGSPVLPSQPSPLSPTKCLAGGKKVPIYHNAHKIFRAQQFARQMKTTSSDMDTTKPQPHSKPPPQPPVQAKTLSDAAKLYVNPPVLEPSQPPPLSPQHVPMAPLPKYQPQPAPTLLQSVQKGTIIMPKFSFYKIILRTR